MSEDNSTSAIERTVALLEADMSFGKYSFNDNKFDNKYSPFWFLHLMRRIIARTSGRNQNKNIEPKLC